MVGSGPGLQPLARGLGAPLLLPLGAAAAARNRPQSVDAGFTSAVTQPTRRAFCIFPLQNTFLSYHFCRLRVGGRDAVTMTSVTSRVEEVRIYLPTKTVKLSFEHKCLKKERRLKKGS